MSKAFDLLSESLNDVILDTQTQHLPRHKRKIDIKPSGPSRRLLGLIATKKISIQKITCFKGHHHFLETGDFFCILYRLPAFNVC